MEVRKVRIIDEKGNARFVMPHIANNSKLMKSYGFTKEDANDQPEEVQEETPVFHPIEGVDFLEVETEPQPEEVQEETPVKVKRNRKENGNT